MKKQKQIYVSPETETLVVRFEGSLMTVSGPGSGYNKSGNAGNTMTEDDDYDYDDDDDFDGLFDMLKKR